MHGTHICYVLKYVVTHADSASEKQKLGCGTVTSTKQSQIHSPSELLAVSVRPNTSIHNCSSPLPKEVSKARNQVGGRQFIRATAGGEG